jgi:hypothetical protein
MRQAQPFISWPLLASQYQVAAAAQPQRIGRHEFGLAQDVGAVQLQLNPELAKRLPHCLLGHRLQPKARKISSLSLNVYHAHLAVGVEYAQQYTEAVVLGELLINDSYECCEPHYKQVYCYAGSVGHQLISTPTGY